MVETLDVRGLKCPLPALLCRKRLAQAAAGTVLVVLADDPMAPVDIPFMCHGLGVDVLDVTRNGDESRLRLRKPAQA